MVTDVKIDNVGGPRPQLGVASEATLQALLDATRGSGRSERDRSRLQENYDRSIRDTSQSQGLFKRAIVSGVASVYNFGKELAFGGDRASNFADAVFGSTSMVSKLTRYLEENIDTWRTLSSVGASFNNSIFDMIASAANSGMNLDDFANMVRDNSIAMSRLGKTTSQGARFIGEFSNDFRSGIGLQFFEMGYTIQDVNEGLIGFMMLERQRSADALASDRSQQEAAALYLLSLDKLTKVTGRQRKQIEDALAQQMQDAGIRSQINRLEGQARTNLQETLAFLDTELQGPLADGLKDLMDGVAQTHLGEALQSQVPGIGEFARQMFEGGATVDEVISQLGTRFGPQLSRLAGTFSKAQLDQMRMSGGVAGAIAEILDSSYQLNQIVGKDAEAALAEQRRREPLTAALGKFEQAIIDLRKEVTDAFFDIINLPGGLVESFGELGQTIADLTGTGEMSVSGIVPSISGFIRMLFGPDSLLNEYIGKLTIWLKSGGLTDALESLQGAVQSVVEYFNQFLSDVSEQGFFQTIKNRFLELVDYVKTIFKDIFYGKEITAGPMNQVVGREGGVMKIITDGLTAMFDSAFSDTGWATKFVTASYNWLVDTLFGEKGKNGERSGGLLDTSYNWLVDTLFGEKGKNGERSGGLLDSATNYIMDTLFPADTPGMGIWDRIIDTIMDGLFGENITNPFTGVETDIRPGQYKWFARIEKALNDWFGLSLLEAQTGGPSLYDQVTVKINDMFDGLKLTLEAGLIELLELLNTGFAGWFIDDERLAERRIMYEATTLGRSTDPADIERKNAEIQRLQSQLQQLQTPTTKFSPRGIYTAPLDYDRINSVKAQLEALGVRGLNQGTNGFENFGKGTLTMLHGAEAVVPRNTPAGELLQQYFNKENNENSATTIPTSSQTNQSDLSSKIDQLNTVMSRVAVLMEASVGVQTRTMQNIKGLSTDIIKGIPR